MQSVFRNIVLILAVIGALIIGGGSFVGLLYHFEGKDLPSIVLSVIFVFVSLLLMFWLWSVKEREKNYGFTGTEAMVLLVYLGAAIPSLLAIAHAVNIELSLKSEIQDKANNKLDSMVSMCIVYEDSVNYVGNLVLREVENKINARRQGSIRSSDLISYFDECAMPLQLATVPNALSIAQTAMNNHKAAKVNAGKAIRSDLDQFVSIKRNVINSWNLFSIKNTLDEIDKKAQSVYIGLQNAFQIPKESRVWNKHIFSYQIAQDIAPILSSAKELRKQPNFSWIWPVIIWGLAHLFLLSIYLFSKRTGIKLPKFYYKNAKKSDKSIGLDI